MNLRDSVAGNSLSFTPTLCPEGRADQTAIDAQLRQRKFHSMERNYMDSLIHGLQNGSEQ